MTTFLYGPSYTDLRREAFDKASELASDDPASIRWLANNSHIYDQIEDAWAREHTPLRLTVSSLDQTIGECLDRLTGPRQRLDALTRRCLVDSALRSIDREGLLDDAHRYRSELLDLFGTLESEGYGEPSALERLILESDVPDRASTVLVDSYREYQRLIADVTTEEEYTGYEAYRDILDADLGSLLPITDVIVLSGYYDLAATERRVIEKLAADFEVIILLPWVETSAEGIGANQAAIDAKSFYSDLATDTRQIRVAEDDPLTTAAGSLYTANPPESLEEGSARVRWVKAPTPDREIRQVARSIKHRLNNDENVTQENTQVVVPGLISYREHVEDIFQAHGLTPVTVVNKLLYQTNTGRGMLDLVELCTDDEIGGDTIAALATNPAVDLGLDGATVSELVRALPGNSVEDLRTELPESDRKALDALLDKVSEIATTDDARVVSEVRNLFESVGLEAEGTPFTEATRFDAVMEERAVRRVDRALKAIERVATATEGEDVLTRIEDEFDQIRVPPPSQSSEGVLEVAGPREALGQSYDHLYLVGLTARDFPPSAERPVFFETLWDELTGIEPTDHRAVARYQFVTMIASAESVYITTPETTSGGDPLMESSILDEFQRVTSIRPEADNLGNGFVEDAQRAVGRLQTRSASEAVEEMINAGTFDTEVSSRVRDGVTCAQQRGGAERTEHDGLLDPDTVDALYPPEDREPYSPSQLTDYAKCGFRFLMERILDIEEPRQYDLEPNPLDIGTVSHDTLEYFYTGLQSGPGDHVDLSKYPLEDLEERMLTAGERAVAEASLPYDDSFYQCWLESLFAGLCDSDRNQYYGNDDSIHALEEGLFLKFLRKERDRDPEDGPGWFEVQLDLTDSEDGAIEFELPSGRTVPIGGRIDRVTVERSGDPPKGLVHDYKTGGGNQRQAVDGVTFQLPLYASATSRALEDEGVQTPVDAAFYALNHDDLGDGWSLSYYLYREGESEDSSEHYRRLIEDETPQRIGEIVSGIEDGVFQPTVLDEDTAGCRHCEFSDVCDVRYHMRRDIIETVDDDERAGYVPQYARTDSFLDASWGDQE